MKNSVTQIVLLGGGYVSVWAYRSLVKNLKHEINGGKVQITVVCPEEYHFFHGWTAESLTYVIQDQSRMTPLAEIFPKAHFISGKATAINSEKNFVHIEMNNGSEQFIQYDYLLLGMGSFDNNQVEGLTQYGYQVKSHQAFLRTKQMIRQIVKQASVIQMADAQKLLSFTIAGGGFTGVELAANIAEFIDLLRKQYPSLQNIKPLIRLVNSGNRIMNELQPRFERMIRYAEKQMNNYGIEIINNNKIIKVTKEGALLNNGFFIESSMVIATIGQCRLVLRGTEDMKRDQMKRIYTNVYMQITNHKNIWGGGDSCHVMRCKTMKACPANALWAMKHGEYAGRNIALAIKNKPLKIFSYKGLGQAASLGIGKGIGELYGIQFTGWIAWVMRLVVFNYFMPSRKVMLNEIKDWLFLLFRRQRKGLWVEKDREKKNFSLNNIPDK